MNLYPVTIVENFYDDPDAVRTFALSQKYQYRHQLKDVPYVFPGARTKDLSVINKPLFEQVSNKIISLFHNPDHERMRWAISTNFQSVSEDYGRGVIHTDGNAVFAAVLYLSPDAPLDSGTSLFKRNKQFDQTAYEKALNENDKRFAAGTIAMDTGYHSMFDEIVRINNVYNTLILYEGRHYHAANKFFGKTLKDSRLAQVFFVSSIDAQKHSSFPIWRSQQIKI
ncbi:MULTISPECIES: DUF6445 family protein [unclassified Methylophilus]|uniref:DUF6445 family protein n=1 Tax=unclassified Methylophilus TaxID=2630143 RepID=UPI000701605C|nr:MULTISPECIES: DUF6445 family protein [unclassified Methylophilus]KQT41462.1 hypothetical protein ASG34_12065 [Methylophilus sp. Leaf416]KQT57983.1 hypothetical protein ASG44_13665 [Methylophilus sp. Leaf459]